MELVKNIFFNTDILTPNSKVKISYTGKFFEDASKTVVLHYCFDNNWEYVVDIEMNKTELGYQAELEIQDNKSINISFFNEKNEWDNNKSENYNFQIEEKDYSLAEIENQYALRTYSKFYSWRNEVKITIIKAITFIPKLIIGKYKRKLNEKNT